MAQIVVYYLESLFNVRHRFQVGLKTKNSIKCIMVVLIVETGAPTILFKEKYIQGRKVMHEVFNLLTYCWLLYLLMFSCLIRA